MHCLWLVGMLATGLLLLGTAKAQDINPYRYSLNDFGEVGLIQSPTARFVDEGDMYIGFSEVEPYTRYFLTVQALPWLESTLGYARFPEEGTPTGYVDKRLDVKVRLNKESRYWPQIAVGLRDLAGTGLFASEYLVASKRIYNFDLSLGLGWGYMSSGGQIKNPLGLFSNAFYERDEGFSDLGGTPEPGNWFRGDQISLFGGISYQTPIDGLSIKVELDPNDYLNEPRNNQVDVKSPINFGLVYQPNDWLDLSVGFERGDTFMLQAAVHQNFNEVVSVPKLDAAPEPLMPEKQMTSTTAALHAINRELENQEQYVQQIGIVDEHTMEVHLAQEKYLKIPQSLGRISRIANNRLPEKVEVFRLVNLTDGLPTASVSVFRKDIDAALRLDGSAEEVWMNSQLEEAYGDSSKETDTWIIADRYPSCSGAVVPRLRQHIGGALDTFYAYQVWAELLGECALSNNLKLEGSIGLNVYSSFDELNTPPASQLPNVRTGIQEYLQQGENGIEKLALSYQWKPAPAWYARLSGGILEEMYAGLGGEVLYRPYGSRWALGADLYTVRQRDFDKGFGLQSYSITTGHATLYYDWPLLNLQTRISIGRYLAGDIGSTFDISRRFENGARVGAFVTLTDVSAEEFGEGSFDKGIYVSLPMDMFLTYPTKEKAQLVWRPLTRDGGQKLNNATQLFDMTQEATPETLAHDWDSLMD